MNLGFTAETMEKMVRFVVNQFLIHTKRKVRSPKLGGDDGGMMTDGGPHDQARCRKCLRLGRSCRQ